MRKGMPSFWERGKEDIGGFGRREWAQTMDELWIELKRQRAA